jgi:hypothetical protein
MNYQLLIIIAILLVLLIISLFRRCKCRGLNNIYKLRELSPDNPLVYSENIDTIVI